MISLISPALIIPSPLPFRQSFPDARQLAVEAAVHDEAADLGGTLAVAADRRRGPLQLGFDRLGLVALAGQLEQRLRVRLRDGGRRSHETFIPAIASATMRRWSSSRSVLCTSFSATATARS